MEGLSKINPNEGKKKYSIIHWETGDPKETAHCLVCTYSGNVKVLTWIPTIKCWVAHGLEKHYDVIAWCKLSEIKPYKEETK